MVAELRRYFRSSDFASVAVSLAESADPAVISARREVVEGRLKPLHMGLHGAPSLWNWAQDHGMDAHWLWNRGHLTNVYWPFHEANNGWVDYLRMGYGKPEMLVREMAKRGGLKKLGNYGESDELAFHQVTQLQVGLSEDVWWVNWYEDRTAWLEQNNWLAKIRKDPKERDHLINMLDLLQQEGYALCIYVSKAVTGFREYDDPEKFVAEMDSLRRAGEYTSFSVELRLNPDAPENDESVLPSFVLREFEKLLPLYRFTAWHPKANNALGL